MFKGLGLFFILSMIVRNPFLAIILLFVIYAIMDKAYFGFLPDFLAPLKRNSRINTLLKELGVNPANADAAQELGILFYEKKRYDRALEYLKMAAKKVENSARLYLYIGMAYFELDRSEEGAEILSRALELDRRTGHGLPYIYLLRYELERPGQSPEKVRKLEEGLGNFESTENHFRMGMVYKRHGNREKAKEMFRQALDDYSYVPGRMRKIHRKWAFLARLNLYFT
ncbi:MAG: hypothetical protein CVU89_13390 [Firmicutes bacterium HGW-Firmicutes-14]|nr:MAG: hypothetical protein CVU89_13390 [Firmicutes bacterium HGW-Firmicutes-14]